MALVKKSDTVLQSDSGRAYSGIKVEALLDGAPVQLYRDAGGTPASQITTDANGLFTFWVEEGTYTLRFSLGGSVIGSQPGTEIYLLVKQVELEDDTGAEGVGVAAGSNLQAFLDTLDQTSAQKANAAALGVTGADNNLGTFTGTVIPNGQTAKQAFQAVATAIGPVRADAGGLMTGLGSANVKSSATSTLFVRPSVNVADGTLFKSATTNFATDKPLEFIGSTILFGPSESLRINPTPGTFAKAIQVVQDGPSSGTVAGPISLNSFDIQIRNTATGTGLPGEDGNAAFNGLRVSLNAGGANFDADQTFGISGAVLVTVATTSESDQTGISGGSFASADCGGNLYGLCGAATATGAGTTVRQVMGLEAGVSIRDGASSPLRVAVNCANYGGIKGTTIDAAIGVMTAGPTGFMSGAFESLIHLIDPTPGINMTDGNPRPPLSPTASFFKSNTTFSVAHIFNLPNVTITGNVIDVPNVKLTGGGKLTLGDGNINAGLGVGAPVDVNAYVNIGASTATKYAMMFATGIEPTTIRANALWFDGNDFYFRNSVGDKFKLTKAAA